MGYSGDLESNIKSPLLEALEKYNDNPDVNIDTAKNTAKTALKAVWNEVQEELKCCGVNNVTDWTQNPEKDQFHFPSQFNKPEGCCIKGRNGENLDVHGIKACRETTTESTESLKYYFEGCYTTIEQKVRRNQTRVV